MSDHDSTFVTQSRVEPRHPWSLSHSLHDGIPGPPTADSLVRFFASSKPSVRKALLFDGFDLRVVDSPLGGLLELVADSLPKRMQLRQRAIQQSRQFHRAVFKSPFLPVQAQKMDLGTSFGQGHQVDAHRSQAVSGENRHGCKTVLHGFPSANNANSSGLVSLRRGKGQGKSFGFEKPKLMPVCCLFRMSNVGIQRLYRFGEEPGNPLKTLTFGSF